MIFKSNAKQEELNKQLWKAADALRGHVDASIFKDYILAMLFLKYISDLYEKDKKEISAKYGNDKARIEQKLKQSRFYMQAGNSFYDLYEIRNTEDFGTAINQALNKIEEINIDKLDGIFQSIDFASEVKLGKKEKKNPMLVQLFKTFNEISLDVSDEDLIGNSYMYLIEQFASEAGKKAGEFFTPAVVSWLLARLAGAKAGDRILDPACGSGGLLLLAGREVENNNYALYGQESVGTTYNLARMNMFLHKKDSAEIHWGDSLRTPAFHEDDRLMEFDIVLANPPFSLDNWGADTLEKDIYHRFTRGLPPKSKGDYAFISHMLASAKKFSGKVAVIVPHGVLFRGSSEGKIRQAIIKENLLDTVIGLPANLFQTTSIPVAILIFDRSREKGGARENDTNILFIDASKGYKPDKTQNTLELAHIDKIINTYKNRSVENKYSYLASVQEIEENDYNLNIPRYVDTFEEEKEIDIKEVRANIERLDAELADVESKMKEYLKELGI